MIVKKSLHPAVKVEDEEVVELFSLQLAIARYQS